MVNPKDFKKKGKACVYDGGVQVIAAEACKPFTPRWRRCPACAGPISKKACEGRQSVAKGIENISRYCRVCEFCKVDLS